MEKKKLLEVVFITESFSKLMDVFRFLIDIKCNQCDYNIEMSLLFSGVKKYKQELESHEHNDYQVVIE